MTQAEALEILKTGVNVFLTGEPGSGKSYTVSAYVAYLRSCGLEPAITASTGIAATHIGGMTIHSWSGIGINQFLTKEHLAALAERDKLVKRIRDTHILIIDEVSMLSGSTLDLVDKVCRYLRQDNSAFGGIQIVFVGDFFQLPPVSRYGEAPPQFAFASEAWRAADPVICYLSEQHRQEDAEFLRILSALRTNTMDEDHVERLRERQMTSEEELVKLFPHNADVDRINLARLDKLQAEPRTYPMHSAGRAPLVEQLKKGCLSPESLVLKKGARVMFTRNNFEEGYVNGTTGEVVDFVGDEKLPVVELRDGRKIKVQPETWSIDAEGRILAAITQLPLRLAWAMTVHKSQGMSLDAAYVDLSGAFAYGQGYVALSRVRTLAGLYLGGLNARSLEVDATVLDMDQQFRAKSDDALTDVDKTEQASQQEQFVLLRGGDPTGERPVKKKQPKKKKEPRYAETLAMVLAGKKLSEVAEERGLKLNTIFTHLEDLRMLGKLPLEEMKHLQEGHDFVEIHLAFAEVGDEFLKPVYEHLKEVYPYEVIRLARLFFTPQK